MKTQRPLLSLNKQTIARLNQIEMHHVRGGDGDETNISVIGCSETDTRTTTTTTAETGVTQMTELVITVLVTRLGC